MSTVRVVNQCGECNAIREYPDGHKIEACPRCGGRKISWTPAPTTQAERDQLILKAVRGDFDQKVN